MSRILKFRAWDKEGNRMLYSEKTHYDVDFRCDENGCLKCYVNYSYCDSFGDEYDNWEVLDNIMQYTGLKDKNGTEIFEGDAVCYRAFASYDYRGIVRFGEYEQDGSGDEYAQSKCIGFFIERTAWIPQEWQDLEDEAFCLPEYEKTISLLEVEELEIIGNIHDNPELLGGAG